MCLMFFGNEPRVPSELRDMRGPNIAPQPDEVDQYVIGGKDITADSRLADLRGAASTLGLSVSGNKQKLWRRIHFEMQQEVSRREMAIANNLQREMESVATREQRPVRIPSQREVELHEVTHCPFKAWCDACVQGKSKSNHAAIQPQQAEVSPNPRIQMDFMYARANKDDEPVIGLVMVCMWTRMTRVVAQTKHSAPLVEECVRFGLELNYLGMLEYAADCEPACLQLLNSVKRSRQAMGFLTEIVPNKNGDGRAFHSDYSQTNGDAN